MDYQTLLVQKEGGLFIVTLNRPERLNAINYELAVEMDHLLEQIGEDPEARTVILTGAGRGFCAGADIKDMTDPDAKRLPIDRPYTFFNRLEDLPKPVIAAINGPCNGGGLELTLCCDFRIASEAASFGLGEVKLGLMPAAGGTVRLPRLIGPGRAKEFLYFGDRIDGKEALRIGLVNRTVSPDQLMTEARKWALELAERPPLSLKMIKSSVNRGMQIDVMAALEFEGRCATILRKSEDAREGARAFVEKRKAVFKGR